MRRLLLPPSLLFAVFLGSWLAAAADLGVVDTSFYQAPAPALEYPKAKLDKPRNVILMIGDGMGLSQVALAHLAAVGPAGRLHMERFPVLGLSWTFSASSLVTDSAAAGTALACGVKANNGAVAIAPDGRRMVSLLREAQAKGMATALVAASSVTDATPACFAAWSLSRGSEDAIAADLAASGADVILGGGKAHFLPSSRADRRDLVAELKAKGYQAVFSAADLASATSPKLLGLFADGHMQGEPPEPALATMAATALDRLGKDPDGFFMMVEGSLIDKRCHKNDAVGALRQTLWFDMAVKAAADFAARDGHTLVVVTADHETGGLLVTKGGLDGKNLSVNWAAGDHTPSAVPVFAFGPGAERFAGVQDETQIALKIAALLDVAAFPAESKAPIGH